MYLVTLLQLVRLFLLVLSVLVFSAIDYVFSCVQCVLLFEWRCFANVLWCCEYEIAPTLFRCMLEFRCAGWGAIRVASSCSLILQLSQRCTVQYT